MEVEVEVVFVLVWTTVRVCWVLIVVYWTICTREVVEVVCGKSQHFEDGRAKVCGWRFGKIVVGRLL